MGKKDIKRGRPTEYYDKIPEIVRQIARDGHSIEDIAKRLVIAKSTLQDWIKKHPELAASLREGREEADRQVEAALFKRAVGYEFPEVTMEVSQTGDKIRKVKRETKRQVIPDVGAITFWLKNRKPDTWRESSILDFNDNGEFNAMMDEMRNIGIAST